MSLASFHILFIVFSTLVAVLAGVWGVARYAATGEIGPLTFGVLALVAVPVLVVYGVKVKAKLNALEA